jgi:hypothetical protein
VPITFTDAAGNVLTLSPAPTIWLNTRIFQAAHPFIANDNQHLPLVFELLSGNANRPIPETMVLTNVVTRAWNEIFFPISHTWPTNPDGTLNQNYVFAPITDSGTTYQPTDYNFGQEFINKSTADGYDPVSLTWSSVAGVQQWILAVDADGRPLNATWTEDGTKNYSNFVSSSPAYVQSWVIDNTGFGDFSLEFEWFDLNANIYGPPFNPLSPYRGDMLVVYDATDPNALVPVLDITGKTIYQIADSSKLIQLMAFTGSGANVVNLVSGLSVGSDPDGGFVSSLIANTPKIALIFYSDASGTASGFKLKAGVKHPQSWTNFDVDPTNGRFWIHKQASLGTANGAADTETKVLTYSYQLGKVTIDYENGQVIFGSIPPLPITADFAYYESNTMTASTFISSFDDFVAYQQAPVYVGRPYSAIIQTSDKTADFNDPAYGYGRIITGSQWDADRAILTLSGITLAAGQRLFSDYYYHTFTRLTSDGHGDMVFNNSILVADVTDAYPDYTWGDMKIVNEGSATLEQGVVNFGFRGYDTNNDGAPEFPPNPPLNAVVDAVLDINRPWDIQKGTSQETYTRMGMYINENFIWQRFCPRPAAGQEDNYGAPNPNPDSTIYNFNTLTARGIVGSYNVPTIGTLEARQTVYGRCVWVLGGSGGTDYPSAVSSGEKLCSMEIAGSYFDQLIF